MILILHHYADECAQWMAAELRAKEFQLVALDEPALLSASFTHYLDRSGLATTKLQSVDGTDLGAPDAVINRLTGIPPWATRLEGDDGFYAAAEWQALLSSWLASLGSRVVNRPDPTALAGYLPNTTELAGPPNRRAEEVAIIDGEPLANYDLDPGLVAQLVDLMTNGGCQIAGFRISDNRVACSPAPDLRPYGARAIDACTRLLKMMT